MKQKRNKIIDDDEEIYDFQKMNYNKNFKDNKTFKNVVKNTPNAKEDNISRIDKIKQSLEKYKIKNGSEKRQIQNNFQNNKNISQNSNPKKVIPHKSLNNSNNNNFLNMKTKRTESQKPEDSPESKNSKDKESDESDYLPSENKKSASSSFSSLRDAKTKSITPINNKKNGTTKNKNNNNQKNNKNNSISSKNRVIKKVKSKNSSKGNISKKLENNHSKLVNELLCRWWYALPHWPPENHDISLKLKENKLRLINIQDWKKESKYDENGFEKCFELPGYKYILLDSNGKTYDFRPQEGKPTYNNLIKLPRKKICGLLIKALQNQLSEINQRKKVSEFELKQNIKNKLLQAQEINKYL